MHIVKVDTLHSVVHRRCSTEDYHVIKSHFSLHLQVSMGEEG